MSAPVAIRGFLTRGAVVILLLFVCLVAGFCFGRFGLPSFSAFSAVSSLLALRGDVPPGWERIDVGSFSFYLPPDVVPVPVQGIDSFVAEYRGPNFTLSFDYGWYSDPLRYGDRPRFRRQIVSVDRLRADLVSFHDASPDREFASVIAIHFPDVSPARERYKNRLTMYGRCRTEREHPTMRRIFSSVRFARDRTTSNQAMQLTASKPADCASRVCHRERMLRGMHSGLAAADLVSR